MLGRRRRRSQSEVRAPARRPRLRTWRVGLIGRWMADAEPSGSCSSRWRRFHRGGGLCSPRTPSPAIPRGLSRCLFLFGGLFSKLLPAGRSVKGSSSPALVFRQRDWPAEVDTFSLLTDSPWDSPRGSPGEEGRAELAANRLSARRGLWDAGRAKSRTRDTAPEWRKSLEWVKCGKSAGAEKVWVCWSLLGKG